MSAQGLEVIDETVQQTHIWLNELAERIDTPDKRRVLRLLRATLGALRDQLPHAEAAHLSAQLPLLIRGFFWEGWRPAQTPPPEHGRTAFMEAVGQIYDPGPGFAIEDDVAEVFRMLNLKVSPGEVEDVRRCLQGDLRELWPAPRAA